MKKKTYQLFRALPLRVSFFLEICFFLFVIFVFIFPSVLNEKPLTVPPKLEISSFFFIKVFIFAMFEELIYRLYLPFQMERFYCLKNGQNGKVKRIFIIISNIFFGFAHFYLGIYNIVFAFISGLFFSLIYEYVKKKINSSFAFFIISFVHFCYNAVAFWIFFRV